VVAEALAAASAYCFGFGAWHKRLYNTRGFFEVPVWAKNCFPVLLSRLIFAP
jgi:hypothetical protein